MRIKRLLVGAIGSALVVATPLALSTTAQAQDAPRDRASEVSEAPAARSTDLASDATTGITVSTVKARSAQAYTSRLAVARQALSIYKYKTSIRISGQVQAHDSANPSCDVEWCHVGQTSVKLYRRIGGTSSYQLVSNRATDSSSHFVFSTPSLGTAAYKLVWSGVGSVPAASSGKTIKGSRHPHTRVFTSRGRVYMQGNIDPGWGGKRVIIQRKASKSGSFRVWSYARTNRYGGFKLRLPAPSTGYWYYRAVVPATAPRWAVTVTGVWRTYQR